MTLNLSNKERNKNTAFDWLEFFYFMCSHSVDAIVQQSVMPDLRFTMTNFYKTRTRKDFGGGKFCSYALFTLPFISVVLFTSPKNMHTIFY